MDRQAPPYPPPRPLPPAPYPPHPTTVPRPTRNYQDEVSRTHARNTIPVQTTPTPAPFNQIVRLEERQRKWLEPISDLRHLFIKRVVAGIGWAVHTLVFESITGVRTGYNLDNYSDELPLTDEALTARQACHWINIKDGDYIIQIKGNHVVNTVNTNTKTRYLCSTIHLVFDSGCEIKFESSHEPWKGSEFSFDVQQPGLLHDIDFGLQPCTELHRHVQRTRIRCSGQCNGLIVYPTSIHLPINQTTVQYLPKQIQNMIKFILLCVNRQGQSESSIITQQGGGRRGVTTEIWWNILGMLHGMDFLFLLKEEGQRI